MEYLCSECNIQLNKFEIELNELYPGGKLYCEFCQNKHEREIIKKMSEDFANELDFYYLSSPVELEKKLNLIGFNNYQPIKYSNIYQNFNE